MVNTNAKESSAVTTVKLAAAITATHSRHTTPVVGCATCKREQMALPIARATAYTLRSDRLAPCGCDLGDAEPEVQMDRWGERVERTYCNACDGDLPALEDDALAAAMERADERAYDRAMDARSDRY